MTELKTLKDLESNLDLKCKFEGIEENHIREIIKQLKAEAVMWVKSILTNDENYRDNNLREFAYGTIEWIKHFFNLTEADLEEKSK